MVRQVDGSVLMTAPDYREKILGEGAQLATDGAVARRSRSKALYSTDLHLGACIHLEEAI